MPTIGNKPIVQIYYNSKRVLFDPFITLTVDKSKVDDNLTDFPVYVNLNDVKSGITLTEAQSIRIYKADGTTELPRDIVTKDKMRFKADLSSSTDTVFKIKMDGVSSDYGVSDTYGRNNVWTKERAVIHGIENVNDSTGNGYNGTATNMTYDGGTKSSGYGTVTIPTSIYGSFGTGDFSFGSRFYLVNPGGSNYPMLLGSFNSSSPYIGPTIFYNPVGGAGGGDDFIFRVIGGSGDKRYGKGSDHYNKRTHIAFTRQSGSCRAYINGVKVGTFSDSTNISGVGAAYLNGRDYNPQSAPLGQIGKRAKMSLTHRTDARVSTEYNNQSSPSTFYTIS